MKPGSFPVETPARVTAIYADENDDWLVHKAALLLQQDIEAVTGKKPEILTALSTAVQDVIIIGTLSGSPTIHRLTEKKLNVDAIKNKWEAFQITIQLTSLSKGIGNALIIAGSDKRGTAYGV